MVKPDRVLVARILFYMRMGWNSYIAWWLGPLAYVTIIYELVLVRYIPDTLPVTLAIIAGILVLSGTLGYAMKELRIFSEEHAINAETNPYINKPLGYKEIAGYKMSIQSHDIQVQNYTIHLQKLEMQMMEYEMRTQSIGIQIMNIRAMASLKIDDRVRAELMGKIDVLKGQLATLEKFKSFVRYQIRITKKQRSVAAKQRETLREILSRAPAEEPKKTNDSPRPPRQPARRGQKQRPAILAKDVGA